MMILRLVAFFALALGMTSNSGTFAAQMTVDELREQYAKARPKLEAIWDEPAKYTFNYTIKRWDIPQEMVGKVGEGGLIRFNVYGQKGRWRIDTITSREGGTTFDNIVVSTSENQYNVIKKPTDKNYTKFDTNGQARLFEETQKTIAGLCELAFVLPTRLDVKDILFGKDYTISILPSESATGQKRMVTCAFDRLQKTAPGEKIKKLIFESGQVTFLPDQDWAIDHYAIHANTGLNYEGHVEYQTVKGMNSRTVPKLVEFDSTEAKSTLKTKDRLEAVSIEPGPIDDSVFSLSQFESRELNVKQAEGWNMSALLIAAGAVLIVIAIIVRVLMQRSQKA